MLYFSLSKSLLWLRDVKCWCQTSACHRCPLVLRLGPETHCSSFIPALPSYSPTSLIAAPAPWILSATSESSHEGCSICFSPITKTQIHHFFINSDFGKIQSHPGLGIGSSGSKRNSNSPGNTGMEPTQNKRLHAVLHAIDTTHKAIKVHFASSPAPKRQQKSRGCR